jgi:hypothetical protein
VQTITSVDVKFSERNASQDERMDELHDGLEATKQQVAADHTSLSDAVSMLQASVGEGTAELHTRMGKEVAGLEKRLGGAVADLQTGAAKQAENSESDASSLRGRLGALEAKTDVEVSRVDREVAHLTQQLEGSTAKLESTLALESERLGLRIETEKGELDMKFDEKTHSIEVQLTSGRSSLTAQVRSKPPRHTPPPQSQELSRFRQDPRRAWCIDHSDRWREL